MNAQQHLELEEKVVAMLKTVFDPEIPVDIYSLGLVYKIDLSDSGDLSVEWNKDMMSEEAKLELGFL